MSYTDFLEEVATAGKEGITLHIKRGNEEKVLRLANAQAKADLRRGQQILRGEALDFLPRGQTDTSKTKAVVFIMIVSNYSYGYSMYSAVLSAIYCGESGPGRVESFAGRCLCARHKYADCVFREGKAKRFGKPAYSRYRHYGQRHQDSVRQGVAGAVEHAVSGWTGGVD